MTFGYHFRDHLPADFDDRSLRDDVRSGLTAPRKWLPPKWFYDKVGSELFEDITRLPEYYPTRIERALLTEHAAAVIESSGTQALIELGSGSSDKTTLLLDAMVGRAEHPRYVALDVSEDALRLAGAALLARYPQVEITAIRADFTHQLHVLPPGAGRTVAFLGGTIGNFDPLQRVDFLRAVHAQLHPGDHFLLGADLVKPAEVLVPAYDDAAGVTAAFNLNVLDVINRRLGADFDRSAFEHVAVWDPVHEWIEMRLRATREVFAHIDDLGLRVRLPAGDDIRTEISAKFRRDRLTDELVTAGFTERGWWTDEQEWFSLSLWGVR